MGQPGQGLIVAGIVLWIVALVGYFIQEAGAETVWQQNVAMTFGAGFGISGTVLFVGGYIANLIQR